MQEPILIGKGTTDVTLLPSMANRHGLIAGATGTGKTATLRLLAEAFSSIGVPVFAADVKGDLAGISQPGQTNSKIADRCRQLEISEPAFRGFPVTFWDVFGKKGHPLRTTISDMGPLLLSRLLNLNETQSGVLQITFKAADDNGFLILDLKDLQAMLQHVAEHSKEISAQYGSVSGASVGAIQRALLSIGEEGGDSFFGEPALNIDDMIQTASDGLGIINILGADALMEHPKLYSVFLLWLLSELFERLPEAGDLEKPKLMFFFDEAHLLFDDAPKVLVEKIEQVARLIRSKGVGVFFISQSPLDIPETILGQLGNRIQHALRAFTAKDQKAIKATAETFRSDKSFDLESTLMQLGVGEALVSCLDEKGTPLPAQKTLICPPRSLMGAISDEQRSKIVRDSLVAGQYEKTVDRESAYEMLRKKTEVAGAEDGGKIEAGSPAKPATRTRQSPVEAFIVSAARSIGSQLGREILRGVLGSVSRRR